MKIIVAATLAVAFVGAIWALGGSENAPLPPAAAAAPIPRDEAPGEGQIVLWRERPPSRSLPAGQARRHSARSSRAREVRFTWVPTGKRNLYASNSTSVRPGDPDKRDRVYLRDGKGITEIETGESLCRAFWGADGVVYGRGSSRRSGAIPNHPRSDKEFVNWSLIREPGGEGA